MRSALERLFAAYCRFCAVIVALIPVAVIAILVGSGIGEWQRLGPRALLGPVADTIGFTIVACLTSAIAGGTLGIGAAFLSHEFAPAAVARPVESAIALLRFAPAVAYGWFGVVAIAPLAAAFNNGAASALVACMLLLSAVTAPTAATLLIRALRQVPENVRQAAVAAGATRLQTTVLVLVPAVRRRIVSAYATCFARAFGESAAVLLLLIALSKDVDAFVPRTMASRAFGSLAPLNIGEPVEALALIVALVACACALWVDRDYRGRQWT